jgi:TRAP-type mannitol/chloroaromatic compound transport system substrate-binding protein
VINLPSGEVVPALQRGVIDAAEWSDPSSDLSAGFMDVRKFYLLPGMHQPTGMMEFQINKKKWEELPADLKSIVEYACMAEALHFTIRMLNQNSVDLTTLIDKHGVKVIETPKEIQIEVLQAWDKVAERYCKENPFFNKVYQSQKKWAERIVPYRRVGHPSYDTAADYYWGKMNPYRVQKP